VIRYKNPLESRPSPGTFVGKLHRAGPMASREVEQKYGVPDVYEGVHVGTHAFVGAAYALARVRTYAYPPELTNAGILIGIRQGCGEPEPDMDVYSTAIALEREAKYVYEQIESEFEEAPDPDEIQEAYEELSEEWDMDGEHPTDDLAARVYVYDIRDLQEIGGIQGLFGTYSNLPTRISAQNALEAVVTEYGGYGFREEALHQAMQIVPQRRFLCDIPWNQVACLIAVPPYAPSEYSSEYEEGFPYADSELFLSRIPEDLEDDSIYEDFDRALAKDWLVLYGNPRDAAWWHGTGSKATISAFPEAQQYIDLEEISDHFLPERADWYDEDEYE